MQELPRSLTLVLLLAVLGLCLYRARVQSFTVDEAHVFNLYVNKPLAQMPKSYDAANHVLHTVLMKWSMSMLGSGEMALRVPSLIGAAIYFAAVYHLTTLLFGGWKQLLAAAVLVLHPLLLDLMVAARGYGLALGFFAWALYRAIGYLTKGRERRLLWQAGLFGGLAVASNLTLLIPVAALGIVLLTLAARDGIQSVWTVVDCYAGPAAVTAFLVIVLPLLAVTGIEFYFGTDSLPETAKSLVDTIAKVEGTATWWPVVLAAPALAYVVIPILTLALSAGAVWTVFILSHSQRADFRLTPLAATGGTLLITVALLFTAHHLTGMRYPYARSGLYLIPLFLLALLTGVSRLGPNPQRAIWAVVVVLIAVFVNQTNNRYFGFWRFDAATGSLLRRMQDDYASSNLQRPVTLAISPLFANTVKYYRVRRRMDWLAEPTSEFPAKASTDFFLLSEQDRNIVRQQGLEVIEQDDLSGSVLARRAQ